MFGTLPTLNRYVDPIFQTVQAEMRTVLQFEEGGDPIDQLHGMMHYHMGWTNQAFETDFVYAGKQIRPLLALLVAEAAGGSYTAAAPAGAAIELLHNFSLIHDDIEDRSPTRRGRDTLWQIWGIPLAINAGDAMFAASHLAMHRLSEYGIPAETVLAALRRFDETCVRLTQGQHADMDFEVRNEVTTAEYIDMITGKTSVLIALSAELGARIAGRTDDHVAKFGEFGLNLGLAFQIQDDILGIWGDESKIGKSASTDITTRKKTLPVLFGLAHSEALRALYAQPLTEAPEFVAEVTRELEACGALIDAQKHAAEFTQKATDALQAVDLQGEAGAALNELVDFLLQRQH